MKQRLDSTLTFRLPHWVIEELKQAAEEDGRTLSNLIRHLLKQHVDKVKKTG